MKLANGQNMVLKIVIVGRPNVGKSSLLNLLAGRRVAIVDPSAGVTRDRISAMILIPAPATSAAAPDPIYADLIDTGGYGLGPDPTGPDLTPQIESQIDRGLAEADLVLFIVDARAGIVPLDERIGRLLRRQGGGKPIISVANKVDAEHLIGDGAEAARLGFGVPVPISATTGFNKQALYDRIRAALAGATGCSPAAAPQDPGMLLAIMGKRNAGKSTLVNALAGDDRVIVSEHEGTTRDSVDVRIETGDQRFTAIDTAGVRKRKSIKGDVEFFSLHRALRSIRRAGVCLLLIDAATAVSQVDRQLVNEILKHYRPTVVVVNKWDLAEKDQSRDRYVEYLDEQLKGLSFAPIVFISAKDGRGLREVLAMAFNLYEQAGHRVSTSELNQLLEPISAERGPSAKGGRRARIYYATQLGVRPPTIGMFVNDPQIFGHNYRRFLLNRLRDTVPYSEVPIRLLIRGRHRIPHDARGAT